MQCHKWPGGKEEREGQQVGLGKCEQEGGC